METFDHDFVSKIDADPFGDQQKDFDDSTFEEDDDDEEMKLLLAVCRTLPVNSIQQYC